MKGAYLTPVKVLEVAGIETVLMVAGLSFCLNFFFLLSPNVKSKTTKRWWWILVRFLTDWVYLEPMWSLKIPILVVAQKVKNPPAIQETRVWSLGQEDPLEKGKVMHSSILAGRIPRTEGPGGKVSIGLQRVEQLKVLFIIVTHSTNLEQVLCSKNQPLFSRRPQTRL